MYGRFSEHNAVWGASYGLEHALWFQESGLDPIEDVTFRRSNAWERVEVESKAVRERVGLSECSNFAKYRVTGPDAAAWLQGAVHQQAAQGRRTVLTAMLNPQGKIVGEFSVSRLDDECSTCSVRSRPRCTTPAGSSTISRPMPPRAVRSVSRYSGLSLVGLTLAGPHARDVLQSVTSESLATKDFGFMNFRKVDIGMIPAILSRMTYTGDLGYEIWVAPEYQLALFDLLWEAGRPYEMELFGFRALITLRLEKHFGTWYREYRPIYTPLEAGMDRYLKLDHEFVGRSALEAEIAAGGPKRKLVMFEVDPLPEDPADVIGDEPVWHDGEVVGWITSGGYAHYRRPVARLGLHPDRAGDRRGPRGSRSRSSASAARPAYSSSRRSTRPGRGCGPERSPGARYRGGERWPDRPTKNGARSCSTPPSPTSPRTGSPISRCARWPRPSASA